MSLSKLSHSRMQSETGLRRDHPAVPVDGGLQIRGGIGQARGTTEHIEIPRVELEVLGEVVKDLGEQLLSGRPQTRWCPWLHPTEATGRPA
jgi:hypothetical protein